MLKNVKMQKKSEWWGYVKPEEKGQRDIKFLPVTKAIKLNLQIYFINHQPVLAD